MDKEKLIKLAEDLYQSAFDANSNACQIGTEISGL